MKFHDFLKWSHWRYSCAWFAWFCMTILHDFAWFCMILHDFLSVLENHVSYIIFHDFLSWSHWWYSCAWFAWICMTILHEFAWFCMIFYLFGKLCIIHHFSWFFELVTMAIHLCMICMILHDHSAWFWENCVSFKIVQNFWETKAVLLCKVFTIPNISP